MTDSRRLVSRVPVAGLSLWTTPAYVVCLLTFLALDMFSGQELPIPLPIGPDRVFFALFLLALVLDRRVDWRNWRAPSAALVMVASLAWAVLSAWEHGTLQSRYGLFAILDRLAVPYALFALAPLALSTRRSRVLLLQLLAVLGIYLGFTAIFEILGPRALVWPSYISDPTVGIGYGRARGPFVSSDADAAAMAICLFGSFALRAITRSRGWGLCALVSSLVCLAGVLLAVTRSEWIGTGIGLVVMGLLVPSFRRKLPLVILSLAAAVAIVLVVFPSVRSLVTSRATTVDSVYDRQNTDAGAVRALDSDPLFGIGWVEFVSESQRYVRQASTYPLNTTDIEVHNVPLARLAELGLLGGGLWFASVITGPLTAFFSRRRRDPLDDAYRIFFVGTLIMWLVAIQFSPFPYPFPNDLVFLCAGIVLSPLEETHLSTHPFGAFSDSSARSVDPARGAMRRT